MLTKGKDKKTSKATEGVENTFAQVAYAESGELHQAKGKKAKKEPKKPTVCVRGETPGGMCV